MLAIDWSFNRNLTIFDGKRHRVKWREDFLKELEFNPTDFVVLELGCPLSLCYEILRRGWGVHLIDQFEVKVYRESRGWGKSDENDAKAIYELAQNGAKLREITLDESQVRLIGLYHQYYKIQKSRIALENMRRSYLRYFSKKGEETKRGSPSKPPINSPCDEMGGESMADSNKEIKSPVSSYDKAINILHEEEKSLMKRIEKLLPQKPEIRGLGPRIWAGILATANPNDFKCLSAYLRFCGLVNKEQVGGKFNRHANMLYHLFADSVIKHNSAFRTLYHKCKGDISEKHPEYSKKHLYNAAMNRLATFLAKEVYKRTTAGRESQGMEDR